MVKYTLFEPWLFHIPRNPQRLKLFRCQKEILAKAFLMQLEPITTVILHLKNKQARRKPRHWGLQEAVAEYSHSGLLGPAGGFSTYLRYASNNKLLSFRPFIFIFST